MCTLHVYIIYTNTYGHQDPGQITDLPTCSNNGKELATPYSGL